MQRSHALDIFRFEIGVIVPALFRLVSVVARTQPEVETIFTGE